MKRTLLLLILAGFFGIAGSAQALDTCDSGSYYDPATSGSGIDLQVSPDKVVLYRFSFLGDSSTWWTGVASNTEGVIAFEMNQTVKSGNEVKTYAVGDLTLTPAGDGFIMDWFFDINAEGFKAGLTIPWCLTEGCSGTKELVNLFRPIGCR